MKGILVLQTWNNLLAISLTLQVYRQRNLYKLKMGKENNHEAPVHSKIIRQVGLVFSDGCVYNNIKLYLY